MTNVRWTFIFPQLLLSVLDFYLDNYRWNLYLSKAIDQEIPMPLRTTWMEANSWRTCS